ncbi:hypothetical protein BC835DRAFT_619880 [Cytidiella melzeri]|nr:hypothetical protein BC835DRAFT_619880 [Cytidiella melzeri]
MRFSTRLVLFIAIATGTFHQATVSAVPYTRTESRSHPAQHDLKGLVTRRYTTLGSTDDLEKSLYDQSSATDLLPHRAHQRADIHNDGTILRRMPPKGGKKDPFHRLLPIRNNLGPPPGGFSAIFPHLDPTARQGATVSPPTVNSGTSKHLSQSATRVVQRLQAEAAPRPPPIPGVTTNGAVSLRPGEQLRPDWSGVRTVDGRPAVPFSVQPGSSTRSVAPPTAPKVLPPSQAGGPPPGTAPPATQQKITTGGGKVQVRPGVTITPSGKAGANGETAYTLSSG